MILLYFSLFAQDSEKTKNIRKLVEMTNSKKLSSDYIRSCLQKISPGETDVDTTMMYQMIRKSIMTSDSTEISFYDRNFTNEEIIRLIEINSMPVMIKLKELRTKQIFDKMPQNSPVIPDEEYMMYMKRLQYMNFDDKKRK